MLRPPGRHLQRDPLHGDNDAAVEVRFEIFQLQASRRSRQLVLEQMDHGHLSGFPDQYLNGQSWK